MKMYKVNEIFLSVQGEGFFTGTPMVFVRFSGCNLKCPFCDTEHERGGLMPVEMILSEVDALQVGNIDRVCFTGGEPFLQMDEELFEKFSRCDTFVETNGTIDPKDRGLYLGNSCWTTVSPKPDSEWVLRRGDELKLLVSRSGADFVESILDLVRTGGTEFFRYSLQPVWTEDQETARENVRYAFDLVVRELPVRDAGHPWKLSGQLHRYMELR